MRNVSSYHFSGSEICKSKGLKMFFFVYSDREQLVEAKSEKKSDTFSYRFLNSKYAAYHAQMYADTQTKILFVVFAILAVKTTCMQAYM